jgi:phenylalanyl-tRNA synthetase beta chain
MKIAYLDLIDHLSEKPSKELLSEKLFQLGHEHEIDGDVFDMELTPNRGDCLSLIGLARDLNIFFGMSDGPEIYTDNIESLPINFENLSPEHCPKISFLEIEIEDQSPEYKSYLQKYFGLLGNKKTNLFTDISNYVSYELGQPTHCFDKKTIKNKLVFEFKECDDNFKTLLGSDIQLKDQNCVFSISDEIISLAGVMGGASTACSTITNKALVECAYFNPESIIGKTVKYNLTSDAAHKFERGVDITSQEIILRRFIKIVEDHAKIKTVKLKTFASQEYKYSYIPIDTNKINKILGTEIQETDYLNYLTCLGFDISDKIKVPAYRHDIKTQNDLAEEVARVIGYDNITSTPISLNNGLNCKEINKSLFIESLLTKNGFYEVINFPFTSKKETNSISIDNPLDSNRENFRTSMKDSLVENLLYNERRQKDSIKLFEISDIYTKDLKVVQQKKLGIIISGRVGHNYVDFSNDLNFQYLNELLNGQLADEFFKIDEIPRNSLDTKKKAKIFYVETFLDDIPDSFFSEVHTNKKSKHFINYTPVSEFPSSARDFSFSITNLKKVGEVIEILENTSDNIIKHSFMFDFYKNQKTNTVKLGYRFIFQSHQKTLSDDEINTKVQEIINPVIELDGVSIQGM